MRDAAIHDSKNGEMQAREEQEAAAAAAAVEERINQIAEYAETMAKDSSGSGPARGSAKTRASAPYQRSG